MSYHRLHQSALEMLLPLLTSCFNASLTQGIFPEALTTGQNLPLLKKPTLDPSDFANYWPITYHSSTRSLKKQSMFKSKTTSMITISSMTSSLASDHAAA